MKRIKERKKGTTDKDTKDITHLEFEDVFFTSQYK
jgi:hypothetical protein